MSRLKKEILSKLKEYAGKMGKDHLGGDDSPSPKRGGLRDFDGYDNVDYNQDMPMDEDSPESAHPQGSKKLTNRTTVMDMLDVISHKEFGPDYHKLSTKQKKEVHKLAIKGKLIKQSPFKESVNERNTSVNKRRAGAELKQKLKGKRSDGMGKYTATIYGLDSKGKRVELKSLNDLNKYSKFELDESINEGKVDRVVGHSRYKYVGDGRKGKAIVSGPMKDREKEAIIKRAKEAGYIAKPNMGGGVTIQVESLNEEMGEWPKELTSRYSDEYRFELEKVTPTYQDKPGRAKYRVIDIESGELKGTPVFGTPESLMAFADDLIKPQGGTQSSNFGESLDEAMVDYDFSKEELIRVIKQLKSGASGEIGMIKAFEKALGRELTDDEIRGFKIDPSKVGRASLEERINTILEAKKKKKKEKKDPPLNKPKRGGSKAYYVYVRDPKTKKIKKVSFGSGGLRAKIKNKEARNAFAARHNCKNKKDRTKAGYWSCNLPRYADQLGLGSKMNTFW